MLLKNLIKEYELRHKVVTYKKMTQQFLMNRIDKNNFNLLQTAVENTFIKIKETK